MKDKTDNPLTDKQRRMLAARTFHFTSNRGDLDNHVQASDLARRGLIEIRETVYDGEQQTVYNCTVLS